MLLKARTDAAETAAAADAASIVVALVAAAAAACSLRLLFARTHVFLNSMRCAANAAFAPTWPTLLRVSVIESPTGCLRLLERAIISTANARVNRVGNSGCDAPWIEGARTRGAPVGEGAFGSICVLRARVLFLDTLSRLELHGSICTRLREAKESEDVHSFIGRKQLTV